MTNDQSVRCPVSGCLQFMASMPSLVIGHWSLVIKSFSSWLLLEDTAWGRLSIDRIEPAFWSAGWRRNGFGNGRHTASGILVGEDHGRDAAVPGANSLRPRHFAMDVGHVGQTPVHALGLSGIDPLNVFIGP